MAVVGGGLLCGSAIISNGESYYYCMCNQMGGINIFQSGVLVPQLKLGWGANSIVFNIVFDVEFIAITMELTTHCHPPPPPDALMGLTSSPHWLPIHYYLLLLHPQLTSSRPQRSRTQFSMGWRVDE